MKKIFLVLGLFLLFPQFAEAQSQRNPCYTTGAQSNNGMLNCIDVGTATPLPVAPSAYPSGATPLATSNSGTTASVTVVLPAVANKITYMCGFSITSNATAATSGTALAGGLVFNQAVAALPAVAELKQTFIPCISAGTANTNIAIISAAAGAGGVTDVSAWGYQQ